MTRDEDGDSGRQLRLHERCDVCYDEGRRAGVALVGAAGCAAAPAPLVKGVASDAVLGEEGEELVIAVYVIVKAMDKY